jgi:hypothetical protein
MAAADDADTVDELAEADKLNDIWRIAEVEIMPILEKPYKEQSWRPLQGSNLRQPA